MSKFQLSLSAATLAGLAACSATGTSPDTGQPRSEVGTTRADPATAPAAHRVVPTSEVEWGPLNPARGVDGPRAGNLWGDRTTAGPSGFLVEFTDGFESPPHLHNVSYRGVVISGLVHNDDPDAGEMWLPAGSYWTQPKGAVHITAAKGTRNLAYIEIEEGPYLVRPVDESFESPEVPINVHASNLVWLEMPAGRASGHGPEVAYLWGKPQSDQRSGALVELPAGFAGSIRSHGASLDAVVIRGRVDYRVPGESRVQPLEPGSHFSSKGESSHELSCERGEGCLVYVRTEGKFDVSPGRPGK